MRNNNQRKSRVNGQQRQIQDNDAGQEERSGPDYIAMQYRPIQNEQGWKTRKERIGAAFCNASNGSICFRPAGRQIIEGDIYLFPSDNQPE